MDIFENQSLIEILYGDHDDFEPIERTFIDEHKGWNSFRHIVKHISTGKFYAINAAHSYWDGIDPYEENPIEVFPKEKTITIYE